MAKPEGPTPEVYRQIGEALRAAREEQGISQAELARRSGVKRPHLRNVEAGSQSVGLEKIIAVAEALGLKPTQWLPESLCPEGSRKGSTCSWTFPSPSSPMPV